MYERQDRVDEYEGLVEKYKQERLDYLKKWTGLNEEIIEAV